MSKAHTKIVGLHHSDWKHPIFQCTVTTQLQAPITVNELERKGGKKIEIKNRSVIEAIWTLSSAGMVFHVLNPLMKDIESHNQDRLLIFYFFYDSRFENMYNVYNSYICKKAIPSFMIEHKIISTFLKFIQTISGPRIITRF